jgi:riboflavin synthase
MFTGIIEEVGTVAELTTDPGGGHLKVACRKLLPRFEVSSSVAVSGCCLTVVRRDEDGFWCDLAPETLNRTGFRRLRAGSQVNLEAPLTPSTPLGGHIVQGHVDGTGTFVGLPPAGEENYWLDVDVPAELARYLVEKGSVAVEGISLTVAAIEGTRLRIAIIPYTIENTNLRSLAPGDPVNIECDVLAKYVEKLLQERPGTARTPAASSRLTLERLREEGF